MTIDTAAPPLSEALRVVAVNGAYNASRAMSKWLHKGVRLTCDGFQSVPIGEVASIIGAADDVIAAVHLPLTGDLSGHLLLTFSVPVALSLADTMMMQPVGTTTELGEIEESGLCETGNIVCSAYANSLAKWLKLHIEPGVPTFSQDMVSSIIDPLLMELAVHHDDVLVANTDFLLDGQQLQWNMLLLPSYESLQLMERRCMADSVRMEALHTIAVNGAFNASRAMSKWLKRGVRISTEGFARVPLGELSNMFDESVPVAAMLMELSEAMHGHALFAITRENALQLVDLLMGQAEGTTQSIGELEQSCLEETGNIISGAFVNSWSNWLDIEIRPGVPQFVMDLPGAVLESVVADQALISDEVLVAQTDFVLNDKAVEWVFMLFPAPSAMRLIEASCT